MSEKDQRTLLALFVLFTIINYVTCNRFLRAYVSRANSISGNFQKVDYFIKRRTTLKEHGEHRMTNFRVALSILQVTVLSFGLIAQTGNGSFSQWRGLNRDGVYHEQDLLQKWPRGGPDLLWSTTVLGMGYASAAVTSEGVFTTGMIDEKGYVFGIDKQGQLKWKTEYGSEWTKSYEGTRTTPTVLDGLLYVEGTGGDVVCMNVENGDIVWRVNLKKKYGAREIKWGLTESLLIDGDNLICTPGGTKTNIIALNRHTGELVWSGKGVGDRAAYCSPIVVEHGGSRIIVTMTGESIIGVNAENGELFWSHTHETEYDINPNTPYYLDGKIYCVSGYGTGGVQLTLSDDGRSISEVWRNETLDVQMDGFVVIDGYIYGTSHERPAWHCIEWRTGEEMYVDPGLGKGNVITADGLIYFYGQNGKVGLIQPDPRRFELISSFKINRGTNEHWAHLVISDGILYVRHGDTLMAYDIRS